MPPRGCAARDARVAHQEPEARAHPHNVERATFTETGIMWQTLIHLTFIVSAIGIAFVDRIGQPPPNEHAAHS